MGRWESVGGRFVVALAICVAACAPRPATERAMGLARQHREAEAVAVLRKQIAQDPADVSARRLLVRMLASTGDLAAARVEVDDLLRRLPEGDPVPLIELGHAYELTHRFEEALAAYDEAASRAPTSPLGPREGGMRAARWGEVEEARPRLEEAVRRGARDADTYHALGLVLTHLGELARAEDAYRAGLAKDPTGGENVLGLATVALRRGDFRAALDAYDELVRRRPDHASAHLGRAWCYIHLGRAEEAERALDRAVEAGAPAAHVERQRKLLAK